MKRISPEALSYTDELLAKMRGVASVTSAHLEAWWSTKHRVRRVELFRLLNDLADDERVVKLPGHRWGLPGSVVPVVKDVREVPLPPHLRELMPAKMREEHDAKWKRIRSKAKADARVLPNPGTVASKILKSLQRGPKRADVMASLLDINPNTLRGRLSELAAGGWLAKGDDGRWEVIS